MSLRVPAVEVRLQLAGTALLQSRLCHTCHWYDGRPTERPAEPRRHDRVVRYNMDTRWLRLFPFDVCVSLSRGDTCRRQQEDNHWMTVAWAWGVGLPSKMVVTPIDGTVAVEQSHL